MSNPITVAAGKVVSIKYELELEDGTPVESSDEPFAYLHGTGSIVPGLEEALEGAAAGDRLDVTVPPDKAYGEHREEGVHTAKREQFPADLSIEPGMQFVTESEDGDQVPGLVTGVEGDEVTVDFNHPLAGKTLQFAVEVVEVRDSTPEEREHGHPHPDDGHEGCDHDG